MDEAEAKAPSKNRSARYPSCCEEDPPCAANEAMMEFTRRSTVTSRHGTLDNNRASPTAAGIRAKAVAPSQGIVMASGERQLRTTKQVVVAVKYTATCSSISRLKLRAKPSPCSVRVAKRNGTVRPTPKRHWPATRPR